MDTRKCLHCKNEFEGEEHGYCPCPDCGAATYPLGYKPRILENSREMLRFTKCGMADDCFMGGRYSPSCEKLLFTPNCLVSIHEDILFLQNEVRSVQSHLGIKVSSPLHSCTELDD